MQDQVDSKKRNPSPEKKGFSRRTFLNGLFAVGGLLATSRFASGTESVSAQDSSEETVNTEPATENTSPNEDIQPEEIAQRCQELSQLIIDSQTKQESLDLAKQGLLELLSIILHSGHTFNLRILALNPLENYQELSISPSSVNPSEWFMTIGAGTNEVAKLFEANLPGSEGPTASQTITREKLSAILDEGIESLMSAIATDFDNVGMSIQLVLNEVETLATGALRHYYRTEVGPVLTHDSSVGTSFTRHGSLIVPMDGVSSNPHTEFGQPYPVIYLKSKSTIIGLSVIGETHFSTNIYFSYGNDRENFTLQLQGDEESMHFAFYRPPNGIPRDPADEQFIHTTHSRDDHFGGGYSTPEDVDDVSIELQQSGLTLSLLLSTQYPPFDNEMVL